MKGSFLIKVPYANMASIKYSFGFIKMVLSPRLERVARDQNPFKHYNTECHTLQLTDIFSKLTSLTYT